MNKFRLSFSLVGFFAAVLWLAFGASAFLIEAQQNQANSNSQQRARNATAPQATPTPPKPNVSPTPETVVDDEEVLKVDTDNVILNVRVVDRNGRVVGDVRPEEFKVYEDGILQKIESVSKQEVPVNYGLVVDNSGSLRPQLEKVIEATKIMIRANRPEDATFVIRFTGSDNIELLTEFTKNKADLDEAVEKMFPEGGQTAVVDAVYLAAEKAAEYEKNKRREDKSRRAIILITDGEDRSSTYDEKQLFDMLREADVQIYPIGFVNDLSKDEGFIKKSPRDKAIKLLERLAQETGGKAYFPNSLNELPDIARSISSELRTQYVITYMPSNNNKDGTFRSVKVSVNDDPKRGKRIPVTKTGYTAKKI